MDRELLEDNLSSTGGIDIVRNNGPLPSIVSDWMHSSTAILYIFSKIAHFFYLCSQLVILTL